MGVGLKDNLISKCDVRFYLCLLALHILVKLHTFIVLEPQTLSRDDAGSCSDESVQASSLVPMLGELVLSQIVCIIRQFTLYCIAMRFLVRILN